MIAFAALLSLTALPARADLNAHWRFDYNYGITMGLTDFTQAGITVSFVLTIPIGGTSSFSGTLSGNTLTAIAPGSPPGNCDLQINATVSADLNSIDALLLVLSPCSYASGTAHITFERCGCFDGNTADGDGCDALCHVETCYSCSGDPSVCSVDPDNTPCDDLHACTTGETCQAGVCTGGLPVSPCIDMSGAWHLHYQFPDYSDPSIPNFDGTTVFTQHNTALETDNSRLRGTIDPSTGSFHLIPVDPTNCFLTDGLADMLDGQTSPDGQTLTGTYRVWVAPGVFCVDFTAAVTATRCGGGTLDAGEECDDGNVTNGDGCDATCHVESCFTCTGSPSTCAPAADNTSCEDGNACTNGDTCQGGVCTAGSPTVCVPCFGCDATGQCVPTPAGGCLTTTSRSSLFLKDTSADDTVTWRWRRGAGGTPVVLADPSQATTALCIYDESAVTPAIVFDGTAQQLVCPSSGCWTPLRHGFTYRDKSGTTGFSRIDLRARSDGRVRMRTKSTATFPSGLPTSPFGLPTRAQLQFLNGTQVSSCFEAQYDAGAVSTNADGVFRARTTGP